MTRFPILPLTLASALMLPTLALPTLVLAQPQPTLPAFKAANFASPAPNLWFPMSDGLTWNYVSPGDGKDMPEERVLTRVMGPGPVLLGIPTIEVRDEARQDARLVEVAIDYYATDSKGNLWYFGEDVTNYEFDDAGAPTGTNHNGSWRAGTNGALPGILLAAQPVAGDPVFQEYAAQDKALDFGTVMATGLKLDGPSGPFTDVVQQFAGSMLEPKLRELKYFAKGVGLVREEEGISETFTNPERVSDLQR